MLQPPCCEIMTIQLDQECLDHPDPWDCPDAVTVRTKNGLGFPIRDGGRSYLLVDYCPWCGKKVT